MVSRRYRAAELSSVDGLSKLLNSMLIEGKQNETQLEDAEQGVPTYNLIDRRSFELKVGRDNQDLNSVNFGGLVEDS
ncbi:unnamed protein product [Rhodiola kirilowii]